MEQILKQLDLTVLDTQMIGVCVVLFAVFWKTFEVVFVKPYLALHEKREAATIGSIGEALSMSDEAEQLNQQYSTRVNEARIAAMSARLLSVQEAQVRASSIVKAAESEAAQILKNGRQEIERRLDVVRTRVLNDSGNMAELVVDKVRAPKKPQSTAL